MDVVNRTLSWQRGLLAVTVALPALVFWRGTYDVFNTFKGSVLACGAICALAIGAYRVSRTRRVHVPWSPLVAAAGMLLFGFVVATLAAEDVLSSIVGKPGRHTGLAMYSTYLVLFVLAVRLYRDHTPAGIAKALLVAAVPVTLYGLLQASGIDPYNWQLVEGGPPVFSTFGNANFFAAFLGIVVPLGVWGLVSTSWSSAWRAASGLLAVLALAAAYLSQSLQGPAVALAGSAFVLVVWIVSHERLSRTAKALVVGGVAAVVGIGAVAMVAGVGPFAAVGYGFARSLGTRTPKWETALAIWRANPVFGVGLDQFGDYFHAYRSEALAIESGLRRTVDTPHNIPLDMLANGGLVLAVPYIAFVVATGWALFAGLRRNTGEDRLLLAGLGGGWIAYQIQSLVSIDVPPLAVLHFVLAGAIVGLGTRPTLREFALPGARTVAATKRRKGKKAQPRVAVLPPNPVATVGIVLIGLVAAWIVFTPVRADMNAARAQQLAASQDTEAAVAAYERAATSAPWESRYYSLAGGLLSQTGATAAALEAQRNAYEREPRSLAHTINVARLSAATGDIEQARRFWEHALELDPKTPEVVADAGTFFLDQGDLDRARELLTYAVEHRQDEARYWVALGALREAEDQPEEARQAYERALQIDPEVAGGADGLARVDDVA